MKRKILTGLASLTLLDIAAGQTAAIARPAKPQPAAVAAAPSWTGWYLGGHVGYRWTNPDLSTAPYLFGPQFSSTIVPGFGKSFDLDGVIGGAHLGYNWQVDRNWLVGIEADLSAGSQSDSATFAGRLLATDGFTTRRFSRNSELTLQWQASVRGRLGYIVDTWLWYVTGGVAFERAKWSDSAALVGSPGDPGTGSASWNASKTLTGWVIGAGVEQMFSPNWMWRVEYLYENFGDFNVPYGLRGVSTAIDMDDVHKLRLGISYKFGGP